MNPEFLREGSAVEDFRDPDRIVIGQADDASGDVLEALYSGFDCEKPRVSLEEAELIKYASNALLSVLISYSNELAALCEATPGTDVETIMQGLHLDRRLSPREAGRRIRPEILGYLRAGIGFGGSCLPKDVTALRAYGKRVGVVTPLLDATVDVNTAARNRWLPWRTPPWAAWRGRLWRCWEWLSRRAPTICAARRRWGFGARSRMPGRGCGRSTRWFRPRPPPLPA
jgi:nucleotide sugar dehydrogenase